MNFAMSYSGGKDSALALHRMISNGHNPIALITTVNTQIDRSWSHGIDSMLLLALSDSMKIPLILCECDADGYGKAFVQSLEKAREMGADSCAFGDIDIDGHKAWDEEQCKMAGLNCVLPLWKQNREALVRETLSAGFKAVINVVDSAILDDSFLGKDLSLALVEKIKAAGADPCGENGEYHTFVYGGPVFYSPISIVTGKIIDLGAYKAIDVIHILCNSSRDSRSRI